MTTLARPAEGPFAEFLWWLDLNRPSSPSDLTRYIPVESFTEDGKYVVRADLPGVDPKTAANVTARYDAGVLEVTVPVNAAAPEPINVAVQGPEAAS